MAEEKGPGCVILVGGIIGLLVLLPVLLVLMFSSSAEEESPLPCGPNSSPVEIPEQYKDAVSKAAETASLPESVVAAQINQESGWNPNAVSPAGARGIAQFMPGTWGEYGKGKDPFDALAGIDALGRYMADLRGMVSEIATNETELVKFTLASYNAGPGNVLASGGVPPIAETQDYVRKILTAAQVSFDENCAAPVPNVELGPEGWVSPMPGARLTSGYGPRPCPLFSCNGMPFLLYHEGIDLAGGDSEYFYAPTKMKITYVGTGPGDPLWGSYGEYIYAVQVDPPNLVFEFHEAAQGSLRVKTGDTVEGGTALGKPGATGNSSGEHVHFQINEPGTDVTGPTIQNGKSLDPLPFLREKGVAP